MKWQGRRQSTNVDDRRSGGVSRGGAVGVGGILVLVVLFFLGGPQAAFNYLDNMMPPTTQQTHYVESEQDQALAELSKVVLADTEDVWHKVFNDMGRTYVEPTMVIYSGTTEANACGMANSAMGPFYCPADQQVYIDLSFYNDMQNQLGASGDFAFAYVIAHEVGHHVQTLMGVTDQMDKIRAKVSQTEYNRFSVAFELQADYLAGVYAKYAQKMGYLDEGDLREAVEAAFAVGDDRIQKQSQGYVVPDSFTHGTSKQRMYWFGKGYENGDLSEWDTFTAMRNGQL